MHHKPQQYDVTHKHCQLLKDLPLSSSDKSVVIIIITKTCLNSNVIDDVATHPRNSQFCNKELGLCLKANKMHATVNAELG